MMQINKERKRKTNNTLALRVGVTSHINPEPLRQAFSSASLLLSLLQPGAPALRCTLCPTSFSYKTQTTATEGWSCSSDPCLRSHQLLWTLSHSQPPGDRYFAFYLHMVVVQQLSLRQQPVFSLEWTLFWKHLWTEAPYKVPAPPAPMGPFSSAALSVLWTSWHWCLGTCPCTPRSQGAILTLRSKWWLTGLGFAAFLVKLCQE